MIRNRQIINNKIKYDSIAVSAKEQIKNLNFPVSQKNI